jgi:hypothetical protein
MNSIPKPTAKKVLVKSQFQCCICQKDDIQIHHLDFNRENNEISNLAVLCTYHHNLAHRKGGNSRELTEEIIREFRRMHESLLEEKRKAQIAVTDKKIDSISESDIINGAITAKIILEIEELRFGLFEMSWKQKAKSIDKLWCFNTHMNSRIRIEILSFLLEIAEGTRSGMTREVADSVESAIFEFFPAYKNIHISLDQNSLFGGICVKIGYAICYDGIFHLRDSVITQSGLKILKLTHNSACRNKNEKLKSLVQEAYDNLENRFRSASDVDYSSAENLVGIFRDDLSNLHTTHPLLSEDLRKLHSQSL